MIEVRNLTRDFGHFRAVDGVTFEVRQGDILGFLGPNGAGKSTTMKMVTGFLPPTKGTALVGGHDVQEEPLAVKRQLGYLPETGPLYDEMTVLEFLEFIAGLRGYHGVEVGQAVARVFDICNLHEVKFQPIETLSKGYRRRVGMAQAVLHDPPCLIMDEPTDGLDPNQKQEVRRLIAGMASEKAIILSTHILEEVEAMCNRVIIISGGKIQVDKTPSELRRMHPHYEALRLELAISDGRHEAPDAGSSAETGKPSPTQADVMKKLLAQPTVREVEELGDGGFLILPEKNRGPDLRASIWELAQRNSWPLHRLESAPTPLETVFQKLTQGEHNPARA